MGIGDAELRAAVRAGGLSGRAVCLHSSLRAHGPVEGGAAAIVDAFLAEGVTLLVPTFCSRFALAAPADLRPARNGADTSGWGPEGGFPLDPEGVAGEEYTPSYDGTNLGAIPTEVLRRPGRRRGDHPFSSFTGIGPDAAELIDAQTPDDPNAPLRALAARGGLVVLAGVDLTSMTILHHAEEVAGQVLFRSWALVGGHIAMVPIGGCSEGFERLAPVLAPVETRLTVGAGRWRVYPAGAAVHRAAAAIRAEPGLTHCPDPRCRKCHDAALGGPILGG